MALDTVASLINGINGDSITRELIMANATKQSQVARIKAPTRLTSSTGRGFTGSQPVATAVNPGGTKTVVDGLLTPVTYQTKAVSLIFPIDNLLDRTESDLQEYVVSLLTSGVALGMDREVLLNPNNVYGSGAGIIAKATAAGNVVTTTSDFYTDVSNTLGMVEADGFIPNAVIMRATERAAIRNSRTTDGIPLFVPSNGDVPATLFGTPLYTVTGEVLPTTSALGETRLVVGDWGHFSWGVFGDLTIEAFTSGTAGGYNAIEQNVTIVRAEIYMGYAVANANAFAVLKEVAS